MSGARSRTLTSFEGIAEPIAVVRSSNRKRTVTARRRAGVFEVLIPARFSKAEEERWAREMFQKYAVQRPQRASDSELLERAHVLAKKYLPEPIMPSSVRWVTNQGSRWGSCTTADGSIRLSHELQTMPQYVIDSVLVHELAHLVHPNHSKEFRAIERAYPQWEKAQAFLAGYTLAKNQHTC